MKTNTIQQVLTFIAGVVTGMYLKILWLPLLFAVATYWWLQYRGRNHDHRFSPFLD